MFKQRKWHRPTFLDFEISPTASSSSENSKPWPAAVLGARENTTCCLYNSTRMSFLGYFGRGTLRSVNSFRSLSTVRVFGSSTPAADIFYFQISASDFNNSARWRPRQFKGHGWRVPLIISGLVTHKNNNLCWRQLPFQSSEINKKSNLFKPISCNTILHSNLNKHIRY